MSGIGGNKGDGRPLSWGRRIAGLSLGAAISIAAVTYADFKSPSVGVLSHQDQTDLQLTSAQLENLQLKIQQAAGPIVAKQNEIVARVCKAANLTPNVDCNVDPAKGTVTKQTQAPKK
jgi:hypothetical protein